MDYFKLKAIKNQQMQEKLKKKKNRAEVFVP